MLAAATRPELWSHCIAVAPFLHGERLYRDAAPPVRRLLDRLGGRAANVHFEDHIEDGRIAFDYRMRPGIVQKSNAIELMRSVGLDV